MALSGYIHTFYQRNIFERIVFYGFFSELITQIIFEILLGVPPLGVARQVQWVFYLLLALDYLVSWRKVIFLRITINPMSIMGFIFVIMVMHGLFMGVVNHNRPFEILNDTVPLLMIALNIFRMQSYSEERQIDFEFMLRSCTFLAATTCFLGFFAQATIGHSMPRMAGDVVLFPLMVAAILVIKPFPKWLCVVFLVMLVLVGNDLNRTSMAFLVICAAAGISFKMISRPMVGVMALLSCIMLLGLAVHLVPEDSKTYRRVAGLANVNLSQRTGSIGERQAEWDAINLKLDSQGKTIEYFGLGFGGLYEVARTHTYLKDYGHAHYSWAWFNLRYGRSGYIYLTLMVLALVYNMASGMMLYNRSKVGLWIGLQCFLCLLYCITYVNAVFLISGMQFVRLRRDIDVVHNISDEDTIEKGA